jgi:hypothetical protein
MMLFTAAGPPPCVPAGAQVVVSQDHSAVFTSDDAFAACTGTSRPVRLGGRLATPGLFRRVSTFRLAGRDVAFVVNADGPGRSPATVRVIDLRARETISSHPAISRDSRPDRTDEVTSLVVRHDGAVAWIAVTRVGSAAFGEREVDAARARRPARRLDSGSGIASRSLRLHGRQLSWRHNGHRRSTRL